MRILSGRKRNCVPHSLQVVFREAKEFHVGRQMDDMEKLYHKIVFLIDRGYDHPKFRKFVDNLPKRGEGMAFQVCR